MRYVKELAYAHKVSESVTLITCRLYKTFKRMSLRFVLRYLKKVVVGELPLWFNFVRLVRLFSRLGFFSLEILGAVRDRTLLFAEECYITGL